MSEIKLYDEVVLNVDWREGVNFVSSFHEDIKAGSKGTVIEIDGDYSTVEFDCNVYKNPVHSISSKMLSLTKKESSK